MRRSCWVRSLWFAALAAGAAACGDSSTPQAAASGVIFMYHVVADSGPDATRVSPAQFAAQLELLDSGDFNVMPAFELIDALANGREVPDRSVAITFDDGYASVLTEAYPELEKRGWPFTVFVNTDAIDSGFGGYLSWDDLRYLTDNGATIGNHTASHTHLVRRQPNESEVDWRRRVRDEIDSAAARLDDELGGAVVPLFAYPYGEYTIEIKQIVANRGLYGLGQHSGALGSASDFLALPRYPVAIGYDTLDEFSLRARSRALPVRLLEAEQHIVSEDAPRPRLTLELTAADDVRVDELSCYATGQGRMLIEWLDDSRRRFAVRPPQALGVGRSKVNCTAPSHSAAGVYYWYGYLWMRRLDDGGWYDE